jgi:hypothetical protein
MGVRRRKEINVSDDSEWMTCPRQSLHFEMLPLGLVQQ